MRVRLLIVGVMAMVCLLAPAGAQARENADLISGFDLRIDGAAADGRSGYSVAGAGDVNADGVDDLIVGAPYAGNNSRGDSGATYVIYGGGGGSTRDVASLAPGQGFRIDGAGAGDQSGYSVAGAGDVNDDGIDDIVVGAHRADNGGGDSGASYVIYGTTTDRTADIDLATLAISDGFRIDGSGGGDRSGYSVAGAGDVNGDGTDDLIIGAYLAGNNSRGSSGSSYVIYGTTTNRTAGVGLNTLATSDGFRIDGAAAGDLSGWSVAGAGDINGDGTDDLIIGAQRAENNGRFGSGSSYAIYGTTTNRTDNIRLNTLATSDGFRIDGAATNDLSGWSVAGAGDVNGDGTDDVIIGAQGADNTNRVSSGSSYVIYGTTTTRAGNIDLRNTLATSDGFRIDGATANDSSGFSVAGAGDVNADGTDDLIIGAPRAGNNGRSFSGSSYAVYGTTTNRTTNIVDLGTLATSDGFRIDGAAAGDLSGWSVAGAGDVNADGTDDLLVGAQVAGNNNREGSGSSYVIHGPDTTAPDSPQASGSSSAPGVVALAGTAEPGATVDVFEGQTKVGSSTADANGNWSLQLTGVTPGSHTYAVTATDAAGNRSAVSTPITVTVAAPVPPPAAFAPRVRDTIAPAVTGATLSATRFAVNTRASASAARTKRARGAKLTFRLSEPATVIFSTQRRVGNRWRTIRVFTVKYRSAGRQTLNYSGKIRPRGKARALKPGRYRLRIRPSDPAGNRGTLTTLGFRIVR